MKLNEKLHSYRKKSGLSQQELAEQLDVSRQSVSKWETGITVPSVEKLILLSKLYNVPLTILTDDDVELKENTDLQPVTNTKKKSLNFVANGTCRRRCYRCYIRKSYS